jgi:SAM-dependent methyltransferase
MNADYQHALRGKSMSLFQRFYLRVFGVPEIGVQIRAMHFRRTLRKLRLGACPRILDAGCGIGAYAVWMARSYPRASVVGCDVGREKLDFCVDLARQLRLANIEFTYGDITNLVWEDELFDLVVNIDVLEHLTDYKLALSTFRRLMKPGGYLYLHAPQPHQKRLFHCLNGWHHGDHTSEGFAPTQLTDQLTELGFHILETTLTFGFFGKLSWELNHITLRRNLWLAGIAFPLLNAIARLDARFGNKHGLGFAVLAQRSP